MRSFTIAGLCACLILGAGSAQASSRHHHHSGRVHRDRHFVHVASAEGVKQRKSAFGICARKLDDGQTIRVSCANAARFVGFLNTLYHREGRLAEVVCQAWGHMPGSLHHSGNACDVGQRARNVAWRAMYHVGDLAREYGLTDGCIWNHPDCGHVDVSGVGRSRYARRRSHTRYARRRLRHYAKG